MAFKAEIIADSAWQGTRLTTMELTYPRCIHSEFMTHRMFSRNAASSRAIPVQVVVNQIKEDPFIPLTWGVNCKGMQNNKVLDVADSAEADNIWLDQRDAALQAVEALSTDKRLNVHKQLANRLLEPWMWITVVCTGNDIAWANFFKLRCHEAAEQHIHKIADMSRELYRERPPRCLMNLEWHLPYQTYAPVNCTLEERIKVAVARCARLSYLNQSRQFSLEDDVRLHDRLVEAGHWSPFEHVARAHLYAGGSNLGAFWQQYRKTFSNECATLEEGGI